MPFDPSQPFTVEGAAAPKVSGFDPAQPFHLEQPLYFETERGRAVGKVQRDGSLWLDGEDFGGPLDSFKQAKPVYSEGGPNAVRVDGPIASPRKRTLGERFTSTAIDAANHNPLVALTTALTPKGEFYVPGSDVPFNSVGSQAVAAERERRDAYDLQTKADPFYNADGGVLRKGAAAVGTAAGGLGGGLADPFVLATLPAGGSGPMPARMLKLGGLNAALDVPTQALDVASGVQDRYNAPQTAIAAGVGAAIPGGERLVGMGAGALARSPVGRAVGAATSRAADRAGEAVRAAMGSDVGKAVSGMAGRVGDYLNGEPNLARPKARASGLDPAQPFTVEPEAAPKAHAGGFDPSSPFTVEPQLHAPAEPSSTPERDARFQQEHGGHANATTSEGSVTAQQARSAITEAFPGARITSIWRSAEHNRDVGGAPHSWHLTGRAMDIVVPRGVTKETVRAELLRRGLPITELLDEGDHIHWAWGNKSATQPTAPDVPSRPVPSAFSDVPPIPGSEALTGAVKPAPTASPYQDVFDQITETAPGAGNADLLPDKNIPAFEAELSQRGWQKTHDGTWQAPTGESLFIRSQGDNSPIVQWKSPDRVAPEAAQGPTFNPAEPFTVDQVHNAADWLPEPADKAPAAQGPDLTERALEVLRSGQEVPVDRGPSLAEYLAKNSPLAPNGELLAMDMERWHRNRPFQPRLVREGGSDLEAAAQRAAEAGYFNDIARPIMGSGDNMHAVTPQMLLDALDQELRGNKRYARGASPDAEELAAHVRDLEEMLHELGIDPQSRSNAEIKAQLDRYFGTPEQAPGGHSQEAFEPNRREATYVDADGYPATTPPAALPGDYVVRAEPDGSYTVINKIAGWAPAQSGLDRATALAEAQRLNGGVAEAGVGRAQRMINGKLVQFPDAAHAAAYDVGDKIRRGAAHSQITAEVDRLRRNIGRYMDWSEDLARHPSLGAKFEGEDRSIPPRSLMVRAVKEYAAEVAREPRSAGLSLYDPERTGDLLRDTGQGAKLAVRRQSNALTDAERYLQEERLAPKGGPLAERIARGEREIYQRHVGPGGRLDHVIQRNLADLLPDGHSGLVYHETNLSNALSILRRTLEGFRRHDRIYVSPDRDLALGQAGKGVVLEFDATKANGHRPASLQNETLHGAFGKDAELVIDKTVKSAVRAITVKTEAQLRKLRETPWVAGRFDVEHPKADVRGYRIERKVAAAEAEPAGKLAMGRAGKGAETAAARRDRLASRWREVRAAEDRKLAAVDLSAYGERLPSTGASSRPDMRAAPRPGAIPSGDTVGRAAYAGKRLAELASDLSDAISGVPVRQKRIALHQALGQYDPKSGVVRINAAQELDVRAHELTHGLELKWRLPSVLAALKANAEKLKELAYPGAPDRAKRIEGFAEFGRWYLTNPEYAKNVAPKFYADFEAALAKDKPDLLAKLREIQSAYQDYLKAPSTGVVAANVIRQPKDKLWGNRALRRYWETVKKNPREAARMIADEVWEAGFDRFHFINVAERELLKIARENAAKPLPAKQKKLAIDNLALLEQRKTANSPYRLARMVAGAYSAGHMDIRHGVHPYNALDPEGPGIPDVLKAALGGKWSEDGYDDFGAYLISRRMIHQWDRFSAGKLKQPPDMLSREAHAQAIKDYEKAYPTFKDAADLAYQWNAALWRKKFDGDLLTEEAYSGGLTEHPDYVPANRDVTDKARAGGRPVTGSGKFAGGARQLKGSYRSFIHPIQSMMREAYEVNGLLARNDVLKAVDDMAQRAGPGGGAIAERIPATELRPITIDALEAVKAAARDSGVADRDISTLLQTIEAELDGQLNGTIFRSEAMAERGEPIVYVWRSGKKIPLRLPDGEFGAHLFTALSGMTPPMRSIVLDAFAMGARIQRAGITTHPAFLIANYLRDQLSATALTDVGYKPFASGARGVADEITGNPITRRYNALGGIMGGTETSSLGEVRPELNAKRVMRNPRHPAQLLSLHRLVQLTEISETGTRLGVFRNAFEKAKRQGLSDIEAGKEAVFAARDYFDTDLHGSRTLALRRIIPFFNAGLQGVSKMFRNATAEGDLAGVLARLAKDPKSPADRAALYRATKVWAMVAALGGWGYVQSRMNDEDPEYQAFDEQERATNWFFKLNGQWYRYPKPFELSIGSNIVEGAYEATHGHDPEAWGRTVKGLYEILVPPFSNPWITGAVETMRNRDYAGRPIVPDHLLGTVDPEYQYNSYTSSLGKTIGAAVHVSPALVDYWINTVFGSWGREVTSAERLRQGVFAPEDTPILKRFTSAPERGSLDAGEFYGLVGKQGGKYTQALGTFRVLLKDPANDAKAAAYINGLSPDSRAYVLSQAFTQDGTGALHPMARAQKAAAVVSDLRTDLREGNLTDTRGDPIQLTPQQRQRAEKALATLSWMEMRNALISTGAKGWEQKAPVDLRGPAAELADVSPKLIEALNLRMALEDVPPLSAQQTYWQRIRPSLERPVSAKELAPQLMLKRLTSSDKVAQFNEATRIARSRRPAAYQSPNALARTPPQPTQNALASALQR